MSYTVEWLPDAEQELAAIWMAASDRGAVTAASHRIDVRLQADPQHEGESRHVGCGSCSTNPSECCST